MRPSASLVSRSTCRTGAVLVLVLMVLSLLSLLALGLCHRVRLELRTARMQSDDLRAYYLALGGIHAGMAAIRQDTESEVDHFGEPWRLAIGPENQEALALGDDPGDENREGAPRPRLSCSVSDEEGRLNINSSSPAAWASLPGMTERLICSIVDWQDADAVAMREGAETSEYQRRAYGYRAKNGPMAMIWELALVEGAVWPAFVGEDANGNSLLDAAEDDGPVSWPMDDADGLLDPGLMDFFTPCGEGKVNLNTAGVEVLACLPDIGLQAARALVAWRQGADGRPFTPDDRSLSALDELAGVAGLTEHQIELLREYGSLKSSHFRVVSEAVVREGARPCRLAALVRRQESDVQLEWLRGYAW